jgi:hypothetical protein
MGKEKRLIHIFCFFYIRVRWSPPAVQRGTIVGYDISYRLKHRLACPEEEPRDVSRDYVTIYNYKVMCMIN